MKNIKYILRSMRIPFLILTPACVLLGIGTAFWTHGNINQLYLFLVLIGSIAAHISVNTFNEYYDNKSGLDFKTKRSPFNGGSGALIEKPENGKYVLFVAWISFAITIIIGLFFSIVRGLFLLPIGIIGLALIYSYTIWIIKKPFLCLIAPGIGFGILMVMGTHFVLTGEYSFIAFLASLIPFFLVNNLLLLNQFPDIEADKTVGRNHLPIKYGKKTSSIIFGLFLLLTYLTIISGVYFNYLPRYSLLGLITVIIAVPVSYNVIKYANEIDKINQFLAPNVLINIFTPILISIGLFIS
jgi:1,4-dihydroxy-2-naphthoate octaprenyltransferase